MKKFHSKSRVPAPGDEFNNTVSTQLKSEVSFKVWNVGAKDIEYQCDSSHTLSLYLKGGEQTFRHDQPDVMGQSGKLCLMPKDYLSRWHSGSPIRIAHLYLPDLFIRQEAERHLDIDSRFANLRDLTYQDDETLRGAMLGLMCALDSGNHIDPLFSEEALFAVTSRLLEHYRQEGEAKSPVAKGLSAHHRMLIKAHIKNNLEQKLSLTSLADLLHLSPFHFARMFKQSFGDSPANYIVRQRIERAKALLTGRTSLSQIAIECGFSHQSHFNNYFKKQSGITPSSYRKLRQT